MAQKSNEREGEGEGERGRGREGGDEMRRDVTDRDGVRQR